MTALIRMIRAGRDEGRILEQALDGLARVFGDPETAERVGSQFTCTEADRIAWTLITSRHAKDAAIWLEAHAAGDRDGDVHGEAEFDARRYILGSR
jgi:hypothetical protein